jgi:hypothetical protein
VPDGAGDAVAAGGVDAAGDADVDVDAAGRAYRRRTVPAYAGTAASGISAYLTRSPYGWTRDRIHSWNPTDLVSVS